MMGEKREKEIHLLDYWQVILKRRWVVYTSLAVVVSVTTLGTFLQRPVYTATARLQIEQNNPKILPFQDVMSMHRLSPFMITGSGPPGPLTSTCEIVGRRTP